MKPIKLRIKNLDSKFLVEFFYEEHGWRIGNNVFGKNLEFDSLEKAKECVQANIANYKGISVDPILEKIDPTQPPDQKSDT
jgi:hypothetical protein